MRVTSPGLPRHSLWGGQSRHCRSLRAIMTPVG